MCVHVGCYTSRAPVFVLFFCLFSPKLLNLLLIVVIKKTSYFFPHRSEASAALNRPLFNSLIAEVISGTEMRSDGSGADGRVGNTLAPRSGTSAARCQRGFIV